MKENTIGLLLFDFMRLVEPTSLKLAEGLLRCG